MVMTAPQPFPLPPNQQATNLNRRMKKILVPLLALLLSHAPSFAQSQLTLVIDQDAQTLDWLNGTSITRVPGSFADNTFGQTLISFQAQINSPLLAYSGDGSHSSVIFEFSQDLTAIVSIRLGTTAPPGDGAVFSGTPEGPAAPTFSIGDWSRFSSLNRGDYTLNPTFGGWNGGIHVAVVPEPATWAFLCLGLGAVALVRSRR
jgi:PEP-CTERM motif